MRTIASGQVIRAIHPDRAYRESQTGYKTDAEAPPVASPSRHGGIGIKAITFCQVDFLDRYGSELHGVWTSTRISVGSRLTFDGDRPPQFALNTGVANHPGDLGMRRLADLILAGFDVP